MDYDRDKVDEIVLALLWLTAFEEDEFAPGVESHDWDAMNRLYAKGYISDPKRKAKSVVLGPEGLEGAGELFERRFSRNNRIAD
jgi:hypothetical protein